MTAPQARAGGLDGNARGLIVLAVALIVGFLLLWNAGGDGGDDGGTEVGSGTTTTTADPGDTTSTTESTTSTSTPTDSERTPSEVVVIVLNGSGQTGAAGAASDTIEQAGYTMLEPGNAPANIETTTVYHVDDYQAEATDVALLLGKSTDAVTPISETTLGGAEGEAMVVVVLGSSDTPPADSEPSTDDTTTDDTTTDTTG